MYETRFRKVFGYCKKCSAPVFLHIDLDHDVYRVKSFRCWNGHYREFQNLHFSPAESREKIDRFIEVIGLYIINPDPEDLLG